MEGIDSCKQLTVEVVNRGLKIKIDRVTLMQNYDKLAVYLLHVLKEIRVAGSENYGCMKKKYRALYEEIV